jgi:hypothetical protein
MYTPQASAVVTGDGCTSIVSALSSYPSSVMNGNLLFLHPFLTLSDCTVPTTAVKCTSLVRWCFSFQMARHHEGILGRIILSHLQLRREIRSSDIQVLGYHNVVHSLLCQPDPGYLPNANSQL